MPNLLANAMTWLHAERQAKLAESVSYQRIAGGAALSIQGTRGRTAGEKLIESEWSGSAGVMDWIFRAEDFIVSDEFTPPALRDTVTESDGTIWDVVEIPGEPVWRYSDTFRNAIRVHVVKR